ncbi:hypothetical protein E4U17_003497 [Claviceps sp. LM77 group G4]|nr:hypothetical protein E4U17_003497 [Claviceps sp. LM77 group G4]KAG6071652.1 hypothetical protein E4U33_003538 [Claviceps sp. LM78 group G4]KAG6079898.1 hypothetical protein E4U16_000731 [Claviceps sp. LM84 group G4]
MSTWHLLTGSQVRTQTMGDSSITNSAAGIKSNAMPDGYSTFRLNCPPPAPKDSQPVRVQFEQCMGVIGIRGRDTGEARWDRAHVGCECTETLHTSVRVETMGSDGEDKSLKLKKKSSKPNKKSWKPNKKMTAYLIQSVRYQNLDKSLLKD